MAETSTSKSLTLDGAAKVLAAAVAHSESKGWRMCIAVADPSGEPIVTARMDGAPRLSAGIAGNKAYSVAAFGGMSTSSWWDAIKDEPALVHGLTQTPRLVVFGGGVGIFSDGVLVGAVGVSGGSAEEDAEVADTAAAVIS